MTEHASTANSAWRYIEAVPEDLVSDMHSELGRLLDIDGNDDEGLDYVNDIVSALVPLIGGVLVDLQAKVTELQGARIDMIHEARIALNGASAAAHFTPEYMWALTLREIAEASGNGSKRDAE